MTTHPLDDDLLLAGIGKMLDISESVPSDALDAALAAFDMGHLDAELAELCFDSQRDEPAFALRRDGDTDRTLSFTSTALVIDLELLGDGRTLLGQIEPAQGVRVDVETPRSRLAYDTDILGRFQIQLGVGPFRLHLTTADSTVSTPWITR